MAAIYWSPTAHGPLLRFQIGFGSMLRRGAKRNDR